MPSSGAKQENYTPEFVRTRQNHLLHCSSLEGAHYRRYTMHNTIKYHWGGRSDLLTVTMPNGGVMG